MSENTSLLQPKEGSQQGSNAPPQDPPKHRRDGSLLRLSQDLLGTYRKINQLYYAKKSTKKTRGDGSEEGEKRKDIYNDGHDDENFNYIFKPNEILNDEYKAIAPLGRGSFGLVIRAMNIATSEEVAIKIIRSKPQFLKQAKVEIKVLELLNKNDPLDKSFTVRMIKHFVHHKHPCIVFEMLSMSLYDMLRKTGFKGVTLELTKNFGLQILSALQFYSRPEIQIIHCDLKPENILLRNPKRSGLRVIDFGSSCNDNEKPFTYIQSRFYRSPEVILRLEYSMPIDMWSLGCILVELHTGEALFPGKSEKDQIHKIVEVLGLPPHSMLENSPKATQFFERDGDGAWGLPMSVTTVSPKSRSLEDILKRGRDSSKIKTSAEMDVSDQEYAALLDLVLHMLEYDPKRRIKPGDALRHDFFTKKFRTTSHVAGIEGNQDGTFSLLSTFPGGAGPSKPHIAHGTDKLAQAPKSTQLQDPVQLCDGDKDEMADDSASSSQVSHHMPRGVQVVDEMQGHSEESSLASGSKNLHEVDMIVQVKEGIRNGKGDDNIAGRGGLSAGGKTPHGDQHMTDTS